MNGVLRFVLVSRTKELARDGEQWIIASTVQPLQRHCAPQTVESDFSWLAGCGLSEFSNQPCSRAYDESNESQMTMTDSEPSWSSGDTILTAPVLTAVTVRLNSTVYTPSIQYSSRRSCGFRAPKTNSSFVRRPPTFLFEETLATSSDGDDHRHFIFFFSCYITLLPAFLRLLLPPAT